MSFLSFPIAATLLFSLFFSSTIFAQDDSPHVYTVTTTQFIMPEGGSPAIFDSLNTLYLNNVIKKNEYIISQRALRHMWGHNSLDLVYITEYKSFVDIEKGQRRNGELFREVWSTRKERRAFNTALNSYYANRHSDEIYQEDYNQRK